MNEPARQTESPTYVDAGLRCAECGGRLVIERRGGHTMGQVICQRCDQ